jgi:hypothetical protein
MPIKVMPHTEEVLFTRPDGLNVVLMVGTSGLAPEDDPSRTVGLFVGVQCVLHAEYVHGELVEAFVASVKELAGGSHILERIGGAVFGDDEDEETKP